MQLHELTRVTPNKKEKRVGRGGKRGKTSGRGTKGQKARSGHRIRPAIREILKKLPKQRGYSFASIQNKPFVLNVSLLEASFKAGDTVSPKVLADRGLIRISQSTTEMPKVKILGNGEISKKLTVSGCAVSGSAREKIEKAGGTIAQ